MHAPRLIALSLLCASCSDDNSSQVQPSDVADRAPVEAGVDAAHHDASPLAARDAGKLDAARVVPKQCEPGEYEGTFDCTISQLLPWVGKMRFALVQSETAGEVTLLTIAAGTHIMSDEDSMGGQFTADLEASFDCQTGQLSGNLANAKYLYLGVQEFHFGGPLEGSYELDDAGTPGFDGTLGTLTTPDFALAGPLAPTAMCTWSAARVGDVGDAGL